MREFFIPIFDRGEVIAVLRTRLPENISRREPEGYLLCLNVPVARTGTQEYLPEELGLPGGGERFLYHAAGSRTARRQSAGGWTNISGENGVGT